MADADVGSLVVRIEADLKNFETGMNNVSEKVDGFGSTVKKLGGVIAGAFAVKAIGDFFGSMVDEAKEAEDGMAGLNAVIASTGGKAGVSADMVNDLADSLSGVTKFSDDAIISADSLLLTFTSIGKDIFPQATETTLNMSQALGQDLKSSSIQLGKALNDPIQGMSALSRVGVSFTQGQKDTIKSLQDSGDLMGAQKIILAELETEFGGAARAAGQTFSGSLAILDNKFKNIKESIGNLILPILIEFANWIKSKMPEIESFFNNAINKIKDNIPLVQAKVKELTDFLSNELYPRFKNIVAIAKDIAEKYFPDLGLSSDGLGTTLKNLVKDAMNIVIDALKFIRDNSTLVKGVVELLTAAYVLHEATLLAVEIKTKAVTIAQNIQKVAMVAYNVVMAIATAAQWGYLTALESGNIAIGIITAAQWLFNAALDANPIGVVIIAITAIGVAIYELVKHFEDIKKAIEAAWNWLTKWNSTPAEPKAVGPESVNEYGEPIPQYASGVNNFRGGMAIVGEMGPELVRLPKGSDVIPNNKSMAMMGQNQSINYEGMFSGATFNVRSDNDVKIIAREIFNLQQSRSRGSGVIAPA